MLYLMWQDLDPKKPTAQKVQEGAAAYERRFGRMPNVIAVNISEAAPGWVGKTTIQRGSYWFGYDTTTEQR